MRSITLPAATGVVPQSNDFGVPVSFSPGRLLLIELGFCLHLILWAFQWHIWIGQGCIVCSVAANYQ
jgi:hypothetical protein